jgi:ornithine cyclodeaminase
MTTPRLIGADEIDAALRWPGLIDALAQGHRLPRATVADLHFPMDGNSLLNRAAWIPGLGSGLKTVSVFPGNARSVPPLPTVQGVFVLYEEGSGIVRAVIDGAAVTRWKTVADSLLGARRLAPPAPRTLLLVGAGTISKTLAHTYPLVFGSIQNIWVWNRTRAGAEQLARQVGGQVVDDLAAAVGQADIVSCATMSTAPILCGRWLKPGTHVDLIGAFTPSMREADDEVLRRGRLFVDARETTVGEIGELIIPLREGVITEADVLGDHYDLEAGLPGRTADEQITVFKNGGGAHLDLMTAHHIMAQLEG